MHIQTCIILTNLFYSIAPTGADSNEGDDEGEAVGGDQGGKSNGHDDCNNDDGSDNDDNDGSDNSDEDGMTMGSHSQYLLMST